MGTISKNFSFSEFERSETAERRGIVNVIATARVRDSIQALVINVLQPLRTALGVPMPVNSGYRCPELNEAVVEHRHRSTCRARRRTLLLPCP